ncbi:hypothetical protein [Kitasatospora sp. NPDC058046]|uniref:hypothetical protein n=1 Tax=Kitasatospora sp. NPDC058046 TaxID=3346312 RepID=UPI0036D9EC89
MWHCAPGTYQAVHLAFTGLLGYRHQGEDPDQEGLHRYEGDTRLSLRLVNPPR